jgi:methionyl-tRNA formyltransferase
MTVPVPSQIVICGKGRIATAALSYTVHYAATQRLVSRVAGCANSDDKGYDTWHESLTRAAAQLGVEIVTTVQIESMPDLLLVSLEYDRIIPVARFQSRRLYNIHFSALPKYRGVFTSIWPILNGEKEVGVTLHVMDSGVDTGNIVDQRTICVARHTTSRQLYDHYIDEGLTLFRQWLPRLVASIPAGVPQERDASTVYNRRSLDLSQLEVSFNRDAESICTFVRAFSFPEYQLPTVRGRGVRSCAVLPGTSEAPSGSVLHQTTFSSAYATGDGRIIEIIWA